MSEKLPHNHGAAVNAKGRERKDGIRITNFESCFFKQIRTLIYGITVKKHLKVSENKLVKRLLEFQDVS